MTTPPDNTPDDDSHARDVDRLRRAACNGDAEAFGEIVRVHQGRLLRYAARMLGGNRDAAEDAVQEAFVRVWRARERYATNNDSASVLRVDALLLRTVHNLCLDDLRRARPAPLAEWGEASDERDNRSVAMAERARDAVAALPDAQRAVFVLSEYEGLRYAEISALLDIPMGTVASRKRLAVAALRRLLSTPDENADD